MDFIHSQYTLRSKRHLRTGKPLVVTKKETATVTHQVTISDSMRRSDSH